MTSQSSKLSAKKKEAQASPASHRAAVKRYFKSKVRKEAKGTQKAKATEKAKPFQTTPVLVIKPVKEPAAEKSSKQPIPSAAEVWDLMRQLDTEFMRRGILPRPEWKTDSRLGGGVEKWTCYIEVFGQTFGGGYFIKSIMEAWKATVDEVCTYLKKYGDDIPTKPAIYSTSSTFTYPNILFDLPLRTTLISREVAMDDYMEDSESGTGAVDRCHPPFASNKPVETMEYVAEDHMEELLDMVV